MTINSANVLVGLRQFSAIEIATYRLAAKI